jgi:uncharacterized protein
MKDSPKPTPPPRPQVPSPCISVCRMDPASGLCEGCFRTLDEIADWGTMSFEQKRRVWKAIPSRRELLGDIAPDAA